MTETEIIDKVLTKIQYNFIESEVKKYNDVKYGMRYIGVEDIIHTYFNPTEILNDWFEGPENDPYYHERGDYLCSEYRFINELVKKVSSN